jgi:hypothetical protein
MYRIAVDGKGFSAEASDATVLTWNQPTAPLITLDPTNTHHLQGHTLVLTADAIRSPSPTFQWYFNSNSLAGATFHNHTNANIQLTNDGYYHMVASNAAGTAMSLAAYVKVYTSATASFTNFAIVNHDRLEALVDGIDGYNYTVQATEDFITWTNLQTGVCDFVFTNYFSTNFSVRAFRSFY